MGKFKCLVCGYVHEGSSAPEKCPQCGAGAEKFQEVNECCCGCDSTSWADEEIAQTRRLGPSPCATSHPLAINRKGRPEEVRQR